MRAVRFDQYGDLEVLQVREVDDPVETAGRVVVRVRAAALNPGENAEIGSVDNLAMMADLAATGAIGIPITRAYPLDCVREAYADLNNRHTHGKIVLIP